MSLFIRFHNIQLKANQIQRKCGPPSRGNHMKFFPSEEKEIFNIIDHPLANHHLGSYDEKKCGISNLAFFQKKDKITLEQAKSQVRDLIVKHLPATSNPLNPKEQVIALCMRKDDQSILEDWYQNDSVMRNSFDLYTLIMKDLLTKKLLKDNGIDTKNKTLNNFAELYNYVCKPVTKVPSESVMTCDQLAELLVKLAGSEQNAVNMINNFPDLKNRSVTQKIIFENHKNSDAKKNEEMEQLVKQQKLEERVMHVEQDLKDVKETTKAEKAAAEAKAKSDKLAAEIVEKEKDELKKNNELKSKELEDIKKALEEEKKKNEVLQRTLVEKEKQQIQKKRTHDQFEKENQASISQPSKRRRTEPASPANELLASSSTTLLTPFHTSNPHPNILRPPHLRVTPPTPQSPIPQSRVHDATGPHNTAQLLAPNPHQRPLESLILDEFWQPIRQQKKK